MPQWWSNPKPLDAYVLSIISLAVTLVAAVGGIIAYKILDDSLLFVYGLENCVDFISSALVVWRFNKPGKGDDLARKALLEAREKRAEVGISIVLSILGFGSIIVASRDFFHGFEEEDDNKLWTLYYLALASLLIFGGLAIFKFRYADALKSPSLYKDGICSLIGASLALSLFFNTILSFSTGGKLWWLDPTVAMTCGVSSLIYGLFSLYASYVIEGLPIFSCHWWIYSAKENNPTDSQTNPGVDTDSDAHNEPSQTPDSSKPETLNELEMTSTIAPASNIPASTFPPTIPSSSEQNDPEIGMNPSPQKVDITTVDLT